MPLKIGQVKKTTHKNNKSGYKWVCWSKADRKWKAQFCFGYSAYYVGMFNDPKEAHEKAKERRAKLLNPQ
jgi:hypothetical protein